MRKRASLSRRFGLSERPANFSKEKEKRLQLLLSKRDRVKVLMSVRRREAHRRDYVSRWWLHECGGGMQKKKKDSLPPEAYKRQRKSKEYRT